MSDFDDVAKQNIRKHNPNWPQIPDYPYIISITRGSGKANSLFNLISYQQDTDKFIYMLKIHMKQSIIC